MKQRLDAGVPAGPYSPGIVVDGAARWVYVSGQAPIVDGQVVDGTIEEQTALTLRNVLAVLAEAGATAADVVRCGVYLADLADFDAMNAVYREVFPEPRPARTTIGATLAGFKVEIDCVAAVKAPA